MKYTDLISSVRITGGFWQEKQQLVAECALPDQYAKNHQTGRVAALRLDHPLPATPHHFWDSDVAKWLEAACYACTFAPSAELRDRIEETVTLFEAAQCPDGYLNSFFSRKGLDGRWRQMNGMHELYCAGHIIEAAVAHETILGGGRMLRVATRLADHICTVFSPGGPLGRAVPGHPEIELALMKLGSYTRVNRYLDQAAHFIFNRGVPPFYQFTEEKEVDLRYSQAHLPLVDQKTVEGHAVRAMYLFIGATEVARERDDDALSRALHNLYDNLVSTRMYVTGGIGSAAEGERFTFDYDLPQESGYAETCAAVGLFFWSQRMLEMSRDSRYADIAERVLYNGALVGMGADGTRYSYQNPLSIFPQAYRYRDTLVPPPRGRLSDSRQEWFEVSCCPANLSRLIAALAGSLYLDEPDGISVVHFAESEASFSRNGHNLTISQRTAYPWHGRIELHIESEIPAPVRIAVRIPEWAIEWSLLVDGEAHQVSVERGFASVERLWTTNTVVLELTMRPFRIYPNVKIRQNQQQVALAAGPLIYCVESCDNGSELAALRLSDDSHLEMVEMPGFPGPARAIRTAGSRLVPQGSSLYVREPPESQDVTITAVPYHLWGNRDPGEMTVWLHRRQ